MVYHFAKFTSCLEKRDATFAHVNGRAGFRISAGAWSSDADFKTSKTADFDTITFHKGICHAVKNRIYNDLHIPCCEILQLFSDRFNKIALVQGPLL